MNKSFSMTELYLNVQQYNSSTTQYVSANVEQTYSNPILTDPSKYECAVVSFTVPTATIPIVVMDSYFSSYPTTVFVVTWTYGTESYSQPLIYTQSGPSVINGLPLHPIYEYSQFLEMVNTAFVSLQTAINLVHSSLVPEAPFMAYNPDNERFTLWAPDVFLLTNMTPVTINFNSILYDFFTSLPYASYQQDNVQLDVSLQPFPISGTTGSNYLSFNSTDYYVMEQGQTSVDRFFSLRSILIKSNLAISPEYIQETATAVENQDSNASTSQILSNYSVDTVEQPNNIITYTPSAEYRILQLIGSSPLKRIGVSVFWQSKTGNTYPLIISPLDSMNIKLLFRKKRSYGWDRSDPDLDYASAEQGANFVSGSGLRPRRR